MNQIKIENVEFEKDIGVIFNNELEFIDTLLRKQTRLTQSTEC